LASYPEVETFILGLQYHLKLEGLPSGNSRPVFRIAGISGRGSVRPCRTQFTVGTLVRVVAVAGLVFGGLACLLANLGFDFHVHDTLIMVGPYAFASDSAAFWAILLLAIALLMGLLVGLLAVVVRIAKVIRKRVMRKA
jgi:hypothetical protein